MPQVISAHEDAGQRRRHADRLALAMSWSALAGVHQASDLALIVAGLATVIASCARPLFKWLEFRAFVCMWRDIARGHEEESIEHFSDAMRAFRSRGKADNAEFSTVLSSAQFSGREKGLVFDRDKPAPVSGRTWRKGRGRGENGDCVEVAPPDDAMFVRDSKNPGDPILIFTSAQWQAFMNSVKRGDFDTLSKSPRA
jgi:hypothetical protein